MKAEDRAEAARIRFLRSNRDIIVPQVLEALKATPVEAVKADSPKVDPLVAGILKELRRLSAAIEDQPAQPTPVVNVSPYVSAPAVNVSPRVQVTAPQQWRVDVTDHYTFGPMQGKIKTVLFTAM